MSETVSEHQDMVVILSRGKELLIPPFELARDTILPDESLESAAIRIARDYGRDPDIEARLPVPDLPDAPTHAFLIENFYYLERSEFTFPTSEVPNQLQAHSYLSRVEKRLLLSAAELIKYRREA